MTCILEGRICWSSTQWARIARRSLHRRGCRLGAEAGAGCGGGVSLRAITFARGACTAVSHADRCAVLAEGSAPGRLVVEVEAEEAAAAAATGSARSAQSVNLTDTSAAVPRSESPVGGQPPPYAYGEVPIRSQALQRIKQLERSGGVTSSPPSLDPCNSLSKRGGGAGRSDVSPAQQHHVSLSVLQAYSEAEVADHASPDDCWIIVRQGQVYDVTPLVKERRLYWKVIGGRNADAHLMQQYRSADAVAALLAPLHVGFLQGMAVQSPDACAARQSLPAAVGSVSVVVRREVFLRRQCFQSIQRNCPRLATPADRSIAQSALDAFAFGVDFCVLCCSFHMSLFSHSRSSPPCPSFPRDV